MRAIVGVNSFVDVTVTVGVSGRSAVRVTVGVGGRVVVVGVPVRVFSSVLVLAEFDVVPIVRTLVAVGIEGLVVRDVGVTIFVGLVSSLSQSPEAVEVHLRSSFKGITALLLLKFIMLVADGEPPAVVVKK